MQNEIHPFTLECIGYIRDYCKFSNYEKLDDEQRRRLTEKMTIMICKAFAPRRRYDISKDETREIVSHVMEIFATN